MWIERKMKEENKMNYNLVNFCEFDKYAVKSYCAIHDTDESLNLGDITKVDIERLPVDVDLITSGSPCQSFSVAGKQHGGEKGSGTRSSLLWNHVEVVRHCKPKFVIWENVKNVLSKKHKPVFDAYVDEMKNMGYNTYYQVLNAKNYGIPQNRERIYAISVREDIDNNPNYTGHIDHNKYYDKFNKSLFPEPFDNGLRLRDFLEDEVEEKYYLKDEYVERFKKSQESGKYPFGNKYNVLGTTVGTGRGTNSRHWVYDVNDNISTLDATMYKQPKQILEHTNIKGNEQVHRNHLLLTFDTMEGVNRQPKVLVREATKKGYAETYDGDSINLEQPNNTTRRGRVGKQCAQTLTTSPQQATLQNMSIRKLTPKECYRLMGFSDEDFEKAKATGNSSSQLYKQAGNSIVVNVIEEIYKCLHSAYPNDFTKGMNVISLFSGIGAFEKALERVDFD
nr:MAG TPA: Cytosine specific methyltransferase [Caudoviricetes sp.]